MKNKTVRVLFSIITVIAIAIFLFLQLESNKAEIKKVTEIANIKGRFVPVRTQVIELNTMDDKVKSNGFIRPYIDLYVISETQGQIIQVYKEKGDLVKKGDIIAEVDSELLQAQLEATEAAIAQLEKDEARFLKLESQNAVTRRDLENIQLNLKTNRAKLVTARRQLADTKIKAPVSGVINDDFIEIGQFVGGGGKICNIVDINKLKLTIKITEENLQATKTGQKAIVTSSVYPKEEFSANVVSIADKAGMGNNFDVELVMNNNHNIQLKAGQYVDVELVKPSSSSNIYIPRKTINGSLKNATVYIIEHNKAIEKQIITGKVIDDMVEVLQGLNQGDEIVTAGNYNLYNGATVKVII
ncbi:efflux RND transporter periplasmic adaptor subunit [Labilibacter sediminis]|nr:efflux RND transporter periplasmic adaptor subunit [Labilibacter sediminis]